MASLGLINLAPLGCAFSLNEQTTEHQTVGVSLYRLSALCHEVAIWGCIGRIMVCATAATRKEVKASTGRAVQNGVIREREGTSDRVCDRLRA